MSEDVERQIPESCTIVAQPNESIQASGSRHLLSRQRKLPRKSVHNSMEGKRVTRASMLAAILTRALANMPSSAAAAAASSSNLQLHGCFRNGSKQPNSDNKNKSRQFTLTGL